MPDRYRNVSIRAPMATPNPAISSRAMVRYTARKLMLVIDLPSNSPRPMA